MFEITNTIETPAWMKSFNSTEPVFIRKMDSRKICEVNERAVSGCDNYNPIGKDIGDVIHIENDIGDAITPVYFDEGWFILKQETLLWEGSPHVKVRLKSRQGVPDFETMQFLNNMIGFLLHRVRSPLTGIQGYTDLIEDKNEQENLSKYLGKIDAGIDELFELLDELNTLQEISLETVDNTNFSADTEKIISDILADYSDEITDNITCIPSEINQPMQCNPGDMRRILSILIENAIEHSPIEEHEVTISQPSGNTIKIAHKGNPIPKSIRKQIFAPFVTTKARKLGIGLTMAMLYAKRYRGSIFLTDNNPFREVSFVFCLPPASLPTPTFL